MENYVKSRRILYVIVVYIVIGIIIEYYCLLNSKILGIILFFTIGVYILFKKVCKKINYLIAVIVGMLLLSLQIQTFKAYDEVVGDDITLIGTVKKYSCSTEDKNTYHHKFVLQDENAHKILVHQYTNEKPSQDYKIFNLNGYKVKITGILTVPTQQRNPNCFDYREYLQSIDIGYVCTAKSVDILDDDEMKLWNKLYNISTTQKKKFVKNISENIGGVNEGIVEAIMFGDKSKLEEDTYEEFQKNGTAHVLATSGLHVGVIYGFLRKICQAKRKKLPNVLIAIFFLIYMMMAEFSPSIVRAVIMIELNILSKILHRRYDFFTSIAVAGLILLWDNPMTFFNMGFQMSFIAIISIAFINTKFQNLPISSFVKGKVLPLIALQIAMIPYIAYYFNYISISSFWANLPVTFLASVVLIIGLCSFAVFLIFANLFYPFMFVLKFIVKIFIKLNEYTYQSGKWSITVVSCSIVVILLFYGILLLITSETMLVSIYKRKKLFPILGLCVVVGVVGIIGSLGKSGFENANVVFVDVGQGCCILCRSDSGKTLLIDGGGSKDYDVGAKILKPFLLKNGISKVDCAIITHRDTDHYDGIKTISKLNMVKQFVTYEGNKYVEDEIIKDCGLESSQITYVAGSDILEIDGGLSVEIISPNKKIESEYKKELTNDENDRSLVMKVHINGKTLFITGDITGEYEEKLSGELKSDVLQVAHHGSKYSSSLSFIDKVQPSIAVIPVGKNNYGHPSDEVIERYQKENVAVERTDVSGAVGLEVYGNKINVVRMIE